MASAGSTWLRAVPSSSVAISTPSRVMRNPATSASSGPVQASAASEPAGWACSTGACGDVTSPTGGVASDIGLVKPSLDTASTPTLGWPSGRLAKLAASPLPTSRPVRRMSLSCGRPPLLSTISTRRRAVRYGRASLMSTTGSKLVVTAFASGTHTSPS